MGSLRRRAIVESAATRFVYLFAALVGGVPFRVVKKPDTSSWKRRPQGQSGFRLFPRKPEIAAVVKMSVTSWQGASAPFGFESRRPKGYSPQGQKQHRPFPAEPLLHEPW